MSGKTRFILIATATGLSLAIASAEVQRDMVARAEARSRSVAATWHATVEVESLRVLSYLDDDGTTHPADSTLIAPVPLRGPREFTVLVSRPADTAQVAGEAEPR